MDVRGTPWEPNPGDAVTELPERMLITPQLPDVDPTPTKIFCSDNCGVRNLYIRKGDLEKFGHTARCSACEVLRARLPMSGQYRRVWKAA